MTGELIIIGASGLGKEVLWLAERAGIKVAGFLDDGMAGKDVRVCGLPVLGAVSSAAGYAGYQFSVAIGNSRSRKKVADKLKQDGVDSFATLIDPAAMIGPLVKTGQGCILCAGCMATADIEIGAFSLLDRGAVIGHDSVIGAFTTIAPLACLSGNVTTGELTEIGTCASIRQGLTLGRGAMLGMGSVLLRDLEENEVAVGNPAKTLRFTGPQQESA